MGGELAFRTPYGGFAPDGRSYVITRPDTPRPWVNVICPREYGIVVSQAGTGYAWLGHASHNRITRWEQDLIRDEWGRFLYLRDRDSGFLGSLGWQPMQGDGPCTCHHGIGYTTLRRVQDGIASTVTMFVPPDATLEVWRVRLHNLSRRRRRLDLVSYFEWNLGPSPDSHREFHRLFIETQAVPDAGALLAAKRLDTVAPPGGEPWNVDWPHWAFHAVSERPASWDCDKERFLGRYGRLASPAALREPRLSCTTGRWQDAIGALHVELALAAGETRELTFTLGVAPTRAEALRQARAWRSPSRVARGWRAMQAHWDALLAPLSVRTPDPAFDVLTNTWLKYQAISARLCGRTGYFQPGGAFGFRDQLQDSQVYLPIAPERTRAQLLLHAAHQFEDGTAWHWWHPDTEQGLRKPLNDDLLWLPFVTLNYLRETADFAVLAEPVPYLTPEGVPGGRAGTLYQHCRRALAQGIGHLSRRGLPRMGAGDWNDGLSAIGRKLQSESAWLAHFVTGLLEDWASLEDARPRGDRVAARADRAAAARLRAAVNRHFWDGAWYARATRDDGTVIGSRRNREGRIFLNAQTWAVLADTVPPQRLPSMLRSMERHLYHTHGAVLLAPAYQRPDPSIGYLTRYAPGARENGGYYMHASVWAIQAECKLGRADRAWRLYRAMCPVRRGEDADHYAVEPYVMPGNADGPDSPFHGRGGWTWYTGSAAWLFRISTEWLLGVRPEWDGLRIAPCLPPEWRGFEMTRAFRGSTYHIRVTRGARARAFTVDGRALPGDRVPAFGDGRTHAVTLALPEPVQADVGGS